MSAIRQIGLTAFGQQQEFPGFMIGETVLYTIACQDPSTRLPIDLTGANVIMSISDGDLRENPILPPIVERQANILTPAANGIITVPFNPNDTYPSATPGQKRADLFLTDVSGNRLVLTFGALPLLPAATVP